MASLYRRLDIFTGRIDELITNFRQLQSDKAKFDANCELAKNAGIVVAGASALTCAFALLMTNIIGASIGATGFVAGLVSTQLAANIEKGKAKKLIDYVELLMKELQVEVATSEPVVEHILQNISKVVQCTPSESQNLLERIERARHEIKADNGGIVNSFKMLPNFESSLRKSTEMNAGHVLYVRAFVEVSELIDGVKQNLKNGNMNDRTIDGIVMRLEDVKKIYHDIFTKWNEEIQK